MKLLAYYPLILKKYNSGANKDDNILQKQTLSSVATQLYNIQMHQGILVLLANQCNRQFQIVQLTILGMSIVQNNSNLL